MSKERIACLAPIATQKLSTPKLSTPAWAYKTGQAVLAIKI